MARPAASSPASYGGSPPASAAWLRGSPFDPPSRGSGACGLLEVPTARPAPRLNNNPATRGSFPESPPISAPSASPRTRLTPPSELYPRQHARAQQRHGQPLHHPTGGAAFSGGGSPSASASAATHGPAHYYVTSNSIPAGAPAAPAQPPVNFHPSTRRRSLAPIVNDDPSGPQTALGGAAPLSSSSGLMDAVGAIAAPLAHENVVLRGALARLSAQLGVVEAASVRDRARVAEAEALTREHLRGVDGSSHAPVGVAAGSPTVRVESPQPAGSQSAHSSGTDFGANIGGSSGSSGGRGSQAGPEPGSSSAGVALGDYAPFSLARGLQYSLPPPASASAFESGSSSSSSSSNLGSESSSNPSDFSGTATSGDRSGLCRSGVDGDDRGVVRATTASTADWASLVAASAAHTHPAPGHSSRGGDGGGEYSVGAAASAPAPGGDGVDDSLMTAAVLQGVVADLALEVAHMRGVVQQRQQRRAAAASISAPPVQASIAGAARALDSPASFEVTTQTACVAELSTAAPTSSESGMATEHPSHHVSTPAGDNGRRHSTDNTPPTTTPVISPTSPTHTPLPSAAPPSPPPPSPPSSANVVAALKEAAAHVLSSACEAAAAVSARVGVEAEAARLAAALSAATSAADSRAAEAEALREEVAALRRELVAFRSVSVYDASLKGALAGMATAARGGGAAFD